MRIWTIIIVLGIVVIGLAICGCGMQTGSSSSPLINVVLVTGPGPAEDMQWTFKVAATSGDDFKIEDGSIELEDDDGINQVQATGFSKESMGASDLYTGSGVTGGSIRIIDKNKDGKLNNEDEIIIDPDPGAGWSSGWEMILKHKGDTCLRQSLS